MSAFLVEKSAFCVSPEKRKKKKSPKNRTAQ
jgi:hypothetical protein